MDNSTLTWYLIIKSLDQENFEHVDIFDILMETCRSSRNACIKISKEIYSEYLSFCDKPQYIWRQALDGWGGFYNGQWRITEHKPDKMEVDALQNSKGCIHKNSINNILNLSSK